MNDDTLVAYLDGQLDEAQCEAVEAAVAREPALRERLDALALATDLAQRSLAPVLDEAVPPELIDAIWQVPDPRRQAGLAPTPWRERLTGWLGLDGGPRTGLALASVALVVTAGALGWTVLRSDGLQPGQSLADSTLALALDTAVSGEVLRTREATLELLGSFVARDGQPCRAFTERRDTNETLAIACRTEPAGWRVAFAQAGEAPSGSAGFEPASDARTEAADTFLRETLRATALDPAEERSMIVRGWRD